MKTTSITYYKCKTCGNASVLYFGNCPACGGEWEKHTFDTSKSEEIKMMKNNSLWLRPCDKHFKEGFTRVMKGNFCYDCDERNDVIDEEE